MTYEELFSETVKMFTKLIISQKKNEQLLFGSILLKDVQEVASDKDNINDEIWTYTPPHAQLLYNAIAENKLRDAVQLLGKIENWNNGDFFLALTIIVNSSNPIHFFLNLRRLIDSKEVELSQFLSNKETFLQQYFSEDFVRTFIASWRNICTETELDIIYQHAFPNSLQISSIKASIQESKDNDLFAAILSNDYQSVKKHLDEGAEVTAVDKDGDTPLHKAVQLPDPYITFLLLEQPKVDLSLCDQNGNNILNRAVESGSWPNVYALLIKHGDALNNCQNLSGEFPLDIAIRINAPKIASIFVDTIEYSQPLWYNILYGAIRECNWDRVDRYFKNEEIYGKMKKQKHNLNASSDNQQHPIVASSQNDLLFLYSLLLKAMRNRDFDKVTKYLNNEEIRRYNSSIPSHLRLLCVAIVENELYAVVQLLGTIENWDNGKFFLALATTVQSSNPIHFFLNLRGVINSKKGELSQFLSKEQLYLQKEIPKDLGCIFIASWHKICPRSEERAGIYKYIMNVPNNSLQANSIEQHNFRSLLDRQN